jgi:hypothetical protein
VRAICKIILTSVLLVCLFLNVESAYGWSNGGFSADPTHPDYGTHDWIAQHALDWLPQQEKQYLEDNLQLYLYGTELPDNPSTAEGIGDTTKHHVYFSATGQVTDDAAAQRAQAEYELALGYLKAQNYADAAETSGAMTHYIADLAVFGHVMAASTPWGAEVHHSDYEDHVDAKTGSYRSSFTSYLAFDGNLAALTAHDAAVDLAYDTTFDGSNHFNCTWMDRNYDWSNTAFSNRCGQSLNLAVNVVADVLHTLYVNAEDTLPQVSPSPSGSGSSGTEAAQSPDETPQTPEFGFNLALAVLLTATTCAVIGVKLKGSKNSSLSSNRLVEAVFLPSAILHGQSMTHR